MVSCVQVGGSFLRWSGTEAEVDGRVDRRAARGAVSGAEAAVGSLSARRASVAVAGTEAG